MGNPNERYLKYDRQRCSRHCHSNMRLDVVLRLMGQHKIRHLVVVEGKKPLAVIGIRELFSKVHPDDELAIGVLRDLSVAVR